MAQTKALTDFTHDDACEGHACQCDIREIRWVARESLAIMTEDVGWYAALDSPRGQAYLARKRALLAYIEAQR